MRAAASTQPLACDTKSREWLLLLISLSGNNLMFCHQYPTESCAAGDGGVRSFRDNAASSLGMAT